MFVPVPISVFPCFLQELKSKNAAFSEAGGAKIISNGVAGTNNNSNSDDSQLDKGERGFHRGKQVRYCTVYSRVGRFLTKI
jgi:hypothetical protein